MFVDRISLTIGVHCDLTFINTFRYSFVWKVQFNIIVQIFLFLNFSELFCFLQNTKRFASIERHCSRYFPAPCDSPKKFRNFFDRKFTEKINKPKKSQYTCFLRFSGRKLSFHFQVRWVTSLVIFWSCGTDEVPQ